MPKLVGLHCWALKRLHIWGLQCQVCRQSFMCTSTRQKLEEHVQSKHEKQGFNVSDAPPVRPFCPTFRRVAGRIAQRWKICIATEQLKFHWGFRCLTSPS